MPVCTKTISSWISNALGTAKVHMSLGTFHGAVVWAASAAGVSLCPSCRLVTGPEFPPQLDTIFNICNYYRFAPGFHTASCPGPH